MGTMQMVHPHPASLPVSRPLQPRPPFNGTLPLATKPLRKVYSAADVDAAFRADLLAMTRNLRAFALSLVGDQDRADDLVHDTLVRALQNSDRFEPGTNLQASVFTLMRNLFYSEYHRRRREVEDVDGLFCGQPLHPPVTDWACRVCGTAFGPDAASCRAARGGASDRSRRTDLRGSGGDLRHEGRHGQEPGQPPHNRLAELLGHKDDSDIGPDNLTRAALGPSMSTVLA